MRTLLIAERFGLHNDEAEPLVVNTDNPREIVLELDDGERLVLDAIELRAAVAPARIAA